MLVPTRPGENVLSLQMGDTGGKSANPTTGRREAVMGYDEKEEIEATGEWLLRIKKVGFSEELEYVPSRLAKMGVAPIDVVDSLDWLRDADRTEASAPVELFAERRMSPVLVLERPEEVQTAPVVVQEALEEELETLMEGSGVEPFALDYEVYGLWEWVGKVEAMIEDRIRAVLDPEPGLLEFNELSSLMRRRKGRRKARVAVPMMS